MNMFSNKRQVLLAYRKLRTKNKMLSMTGRRLRFVSDAGTFSEMYGDFKFNNPLEFPEYEEKLEEGYKGTGSNDAALVGRGKINGIDFVGVELNKGFMMGSMGTVVGEKVTLACELADKLSLPLIIFSASGGARMQEGMFSLMQMAKTSAAVEKFKENGGLYISVLTHPTTGGVSASFATLGDVILAEPNALIGFAGPRVIEQTIKQKLPAGFQRSEFQQEHGLVDKIVPLEEMKETLYKILKLHGCKNL